MPLYKNVASQKAIVYAYDTTTGAAKTADAANITGEVSKDGAAQAATNDVNPTEIGDGLYAFDLTQAETNCDLLALTAASSTADVRLEPVIAYTESQYRQTDLRQIGGVAQSATDLKDFADAGYDPVTNKIQGVVLVDTTATNSDMRGTDGANTTAPDNAGVTAIKAQTDLLQFTGSNEVKSQVQSFLADAITAAAVATAAFTDDSVGADFFDRLFNRSRTSYGETEKDSLAGAIAALLDWSISGTTRTVKKADATTFFTQTLGSTTGADPVTSVAVD